MIFRNGVGGGTIKETGLLTSCYEPGNLQASVEVPLTA